MMKGPKKKYVFQEHSNGPDDRLPEENERFVRVLCGRGNDIHEVEELGKPGEAFLVSMPGKFRKAVWVKRGDCLLVKDIAEGGKVKGEISEILTRKRITALKKAGVWPEADSEQNPQGSEDISASEELGNLNRRHIPMEDSSSSEDE